MYKKFVAGCEKEKSEYDRTRPVRNDMASLSSDEQRSYYASRMEAMDRNYQARLQAEDPGFYTAIQNGPDGWYSEEKDKEIFGSIFWDYLTVVGWYKVAIAQYADGSTGSLSEAIADAQSWENKGSREAAEIKDLTVKGLKDVKQILYGHIKELDNLVCPGQWYSSWTHEINEKAFERYTVARDSYKNNIDALGGGAVNRELQRGQGPLQPLSPAGIQWHIRMNAFNECESRLNRAYGGNAPFRLRRDICGGPPI